MIPGSSPITLSYDIENRMVVASGVNTGAAQTLYEYGSGNARVYQSNWTWSGGTSTLGSEQVYFYSVAGQKIGAYRLWVGPSSIWFVQQKTEVWFGAKLINGTVADRVGSFGKYYPYGEGRPQGQYDTEDFATYTRDSATGLDYAMNRYYNSVGGSFMTPDSYQASGGPGDPGSWNRFAYTAGDPINRLDPSGNYYCSPVPPGEGADFACTASRPVGSTQTYLGCAADDFVETSGPNDCYVMNAGVWVYAAQRGGGGGGGGQPQQLPELTCSFIAFNGSAAPVQGTFTNGRLKLRDSAYPQALLFQPKEAPGPTRGQKHSL
ncbi:MAG TPA: RHS repeat-associated core domain-containing protein [Blastocatellia bacterium]|nr:RHS repeat-associated core domain-containing protein [Blastocatellia bacterium]